MQGKSVIAIVGAGIILFSIKVLVDRIQQAEGATEKKREVVFTSKEIPVATRITKEMLVTRPFPESALRTVGGFTEIKKLVGRVTKVGIPSRVVVSPQMLAKPGAEPGLRSRIPVGHLAVSVKVNEASSVAGFLTPGAFVDIFVAELDKKSRKMISKRILTRVRVGAVGQSLSEVSPDGKSVSKTKTVTLFLKPKQVAMIQSADRRGKISLALRGDGDTEDLEPDPLEDPVKSFVQKLLPKPVEPIVVSAPVIQPPPQPERYVVELRQGATSQSITFDESGRRIARSVERRVVPKKSEAPSQSKKAENASESEKAEASHEHEKSSD